MQLITTEPINSTLLSLTSFYKELANSTVELEENDIPEYLEWIKERIEHKNDASHLYLLPLPGVDKLLPVRLYNQNALFIRAQLKSITSYNQLPSLNADLGFSFEPKEIIDPGVLWQAHLSTQNKHVSYSRVENVALRPLGEEGLLFICTPGTTRLGQDFTFTTGKFVTLQPSKSIYLFKTDDKTQA